MRGLATAVSGTTGGRFAAARIAEVVPASAAQKLDGLNGALRTEGHATAVSGTTGGRFAAARIAEVVPASAARGAGHIVVHNQRRLGLDNPGCDLMMLHPPSMVRSRRVRHNGRDKEADSCASDKASTCALHPVLLLEPWQTQASDRKTAAAERVTSASHLTCISRSGVTHQVTLACHPTSICRRPDRDHERRGTTE